MKIAVCEDTFSVMGGAPALQPIVAKVGHTGQFSCEGNVSLRFYALQGTSPLYMEMIDAPAGQALISGDYITVNPGTTHSIGKYYNILPGTYVFKFTDPCGQVSYDTITTTNPYEGVDVNYTFPCGSTDMIINLDNYAHFAKSWSYSSSGVLSYNTSTTTFISGTAYRAQILDASTGAVVVGIRNKDGNKITIQGTTLATLADGDYIIKVYKYTSSLTPTDCDIVEIPWTKSSSLISLSNTQSIAPCDGSGTSAAVIAVAQGGSGTYTYNLYEDVVSAATLVAGPQTSNIFSSLDNSKSYILTVNDDCGRGTQNNVLFGSSSIRVSNNTAGVMPCEGDTLVLNVTEMPGITYQWY